MTERKGVITMKGRPLTLVGHDIPVGVKAPDVTLQDGKDLDISDFSSVNDIKLGEFAGKVRVISVAPSLDTPVCDLQLRRFNQEAAALPSDVAVLNITMDLPFAISRFCTTASIESARALSDHRDGAFGKAYGVLIKELRLLARSIFILDKDDILRYKEIVAEQSNHPDYNRALDELKKIIGIAKAA